MFEKFYKKFRKCITKEKVVMVYFITTGNDNMISWFNLLFI